MKFSKDFLWGAATSSYQIEGASCQEGMGPSVWDMMCQKEGTIWEKHHGNEACDHYHRYPEDIAIMKEIGLQAYRFSISWPRILPQGVGKINEAGIGFYDKLVDQLLEAGIAPWATLFHWDFPYELYCRGGWLNRESVDWFQEYTALVVDRLSDRVTHWMTLNEPQCFIGLGMEFGIHAPGDRLGLREVLRASHHVLLAHGKAVQSIRANAKATPQIGWAPVGVSAFPATNSPEDIEAARKAMFAHKECRALNNDRKISIWNNTWWGDPVVFGKYPQDAWEAFGDAVPEIQPGDMELIAQPIDFYGANIYSGIKVKTNEQGDVEAMPLPQGAPLTAFRWPVMPDSLGWGISLLYERYQLPMVVTENGLSCNDVLSLDHKVHDPQRIDFLHRYLNSLSKQIESGVDVRAYFQWSLLDNFEWAEGYKERFGLVYVDYQTQERILKDSAYWYKSVIESQGGNLS